MKKEFESYIYDPSGLTEENDYMDESRVYIYNGFIVAEFISAHMIVTAKNLTIGDIGTCE